MRLLRAKVYRAFPELDRFDDAQCRRFVVAANSSMRRRAMRILGVGLGCLLVVCASVGGIYVLDDSLDQSNRLSVEWATVLWCLVCLGCVVAPCLAGLVFRDWLLRATIRRLIRRCGKCPKCGYSLLGIAVLSNSVVVCPECGTEVVVDPALGELTTDAAGRTVYKAEVPVLDAAARERRRRRVWFLLKWSGIGIGSIVLLVALVIGGWWGWLELQARRARSERGPMAMLAKARDMMAPGTGGVKVNSADEWERFLRLMDVAHVESSRLVTDPAYQIDGRAGYFDPAVLVPGFDAIAFDKDNGQGSANAIRRLTLDSVSHARDAGACVRFRGVLELQDPVRPIDLVPGQAASTIQFDGLGASRAFARLNTARMLVANVSLEKTEYLEALDEALTAARIVERQGSLLERLVANAIRSAMFGRVLGDVERYPDERWAVEVLAVIQRHARRAPMAGTLEFERAMSLDGLQGFFADPKRVARAQLDMSQDDLFSAGSMFGEQAVSGAVGSYAANRDGLNVLFDRLIAQQQTGSARPAPSAAAPTGLAMVDLFAPAYEKARESQDDDEHEYRRGVVTLAAQVYFMRTGRAPSGMADLADLVPDASVGIDPLTSKPWGFAAKAGPDGGVIVLDGNGKEAKAPWQRRQQGRK